MKVQIFSDGACSGNPGPGGWAYVLRQPETGLERRAAGYREQTTNNQMEMMSVIEGLESLKTPSHVHLVTDSNYVVKGIGEWLANWKANGWRRREGRKWAEVKNVELWQRLDQLLQVHKVTCEWIRGHNGHIENEICDEMAVRAYRERNSWVEEVSAGVAPSGE